MNTTHDPNPTVSCTVITIQTDISVGWLLPFSKHELHELLKAMLMQIGCTCYDIEIILLPDAEIEQLNQQSMQCFGPTNVLSFPAAHGFASPNATLFQQSLTSCYGSIAIAPATLHRESFLYNQQKEMHCIRLLAHGLAHLMGYNHGTEMDTVTTALEQAGSTYTTSVII